MDNKKCLIPTSRSDISYMDQTIRFNHVIGIDYLSPKAMTNIIKDLERTQGKYCPPII